jgi:phospholipid/cholesterol/gamma-HCH transport system substrate-binding protein
MLRRSTKVQLILFVILTLVGVSYVSANYVGLIKFFGPPGCTVSADFPDSGGIFTGAEVTYRGVTVGTVGRLHLISNGVRVDLHLTKCDHPKIPASAYAQVSDRSVIGEQYVNLVPPNKLGPYLASGSVIPMSRNKIPTATQTLLLNLDDLVKSVNTTNLRTTIDELGAAFNGEGNNLGTLLDSTNSFIDTATANLPATQELIVQASSVLKTQLDEGGAFASFNRSLALLTGQLKASDPDIRNLLDNGPADLNTIKALITDNQTDLGVTLANLATTGQLLVRHIDGIEQILELYPSLAAGGLSVVKSDGVASLGLVLGTSPRDCGDPASAREGYGGTTLRSPKDTSPEAPNTDAHCATSDPTVNVRGSANVPGGDPISTAGGDRAYASATTANTVMTGSVNAANPGNTDQSWLAILTDGLH